MTTDNKTLTKAELLTLVANLQEQLAAAAAGTAVAQLEAEKAALVTERDHAAAAFADVAAKLAVAVEEQAKLVAAVEAAQIEIRKMQNAGGPAAPVKATAPAITGPTISVRTKPGRQLTRYRAGRAFGPEQVAIALADLSEDDLEALRSDPELVVTDHQPDQEA